LHTAYLVLKDGTRIKITSNNNLVKLKERIATLRSGMKKRGSMFFNFKPNELSKSVLWKEVKKFEYKEESGRAKKSTKLF